MTKEESREYREKYCKIELEPVRFGDYEDEIRILVAHNGRQYSEVSLSKIEAEKVVSLLIAHFNILVPCLNIEESRRFEERSEITTDVDR